MSDSSPIVDEHFAPQGGLELEDYARRGDVCAAHHLVRYRWATRVLAETAGVSRILDLGCGSGYGSALLAEACPEACILACDYDPAAVAAARDAYASANVEFRVGDVTRWAETIGRERFDAIVCFDVIEHVVHREIMMQNLVAHLAEGGSLLLSTPCGDPRTNLSPDWPAHRIEYSAASLYDFLARYFATILRPDSGPWPHREVFDELSALGVDYLLHLNPVICRDAIHVANPYR